jgi:hypothetical protein
LLGHDIELTTYMFGTFKLDSDTVKERMLDIEKMNSETKKIIYGNNN